MLNDVREPSSYVPPGSASQCRTTQPAGPPFSNVSGPVFSRPSVPCAVVTATIECTTTPKADNPPEDRREPPPRPDRDDEDQEDPPVEEPAPVAGEVADRRLRAQALEHHHGRRSRPERRRRRGSRPAEDHHRVDDDQDLRVVVVRERALEQRGVDRPGERGDAAPTPTASSFSQLTGMLIACAASASSWSARHARPVRELFASVSAANDDAPPRRA